MNILEFADRVYPKQELSKIQKEILLKYQQAREENKVLFISFGRHNGRTMIKKVIDKFNKQYANN